jgi:hypothetical protein
MGFPVSLEIILLGFLVSYVVMFMAFLCLCRGSAMTERVVINRANVIPFKRG